MGERDQSSDDGRTQDVHTFTIANGKENLSPSTCLCNLLEKQLYKFGKTHSDSEGYSNV